MKTATRMFAGAALALLFVHPALAQTGPSGAFDVDTATRAYLDTLQGPARAKSDAYFEGGYWLQLWSFLYGLATAWLLLRLR